MFKICTVLISYKLKKKENMTDEYILQEYLKFLKLKEQRNIASAKYYMKNKEKILKKRKERKNAFNNPL